MGIAPSVDQVGKIVVPEMHGEFRPTSAETLGFDSGRDWFFGAERMGRLPRRANILSSMSLTLCAQFIPSIFNRAPSLRNSGAKPHPILKLLPIFLINCYRDNSILQPICMLAELSVKGALTELGVPHEDFRIEFGHKLLGLARELSRLMPHHEGALFKDACRSFPDYVKSRYDESEFNRLQIVRPAFKAQFIAASSLRRVSGIDEALAMHAS